MHEIAFQADKRLAERQSAQIALPALSFFMKAYCL